MVRREITYKTENRNTIIYYFLIDDFLIKKACIGIPSPPKRINKPNNTRYYYNTRYTIMYYFLIDDFLIKKRVLVYQVHPNELTSLTILVSSQCKIWPSVRVRMSLLVMISYNGTRS